MIVSTPSPNTHTPGQDDEEPQHQWEALKFTQVEVEVDTTPKPRARPRRTSLTIATQEESLAHHIVSKRRKLISTMHVVVALLDLLNRVREKNELEIKHDKEPSVATTADTVDSELDSIERRVSNISIEPIEKRLQFSVIEVRLYEQVLDVNPGSSRGPALGIGWRYLQSDPISVDEYEEKRPPRKIVGKDYMPLTERKRMALLKSQGYSEADLKQAVKKTDEARRQRRKTIDALRKHRGVDKCAEKREAAALRLQRITRMRRSSDDEIRQLWKEANRSRKLTKKAFSLDSVIHGSKSGRVRRSTRSLRASNYNGEFYGELVSSPQPESYVMSAATWL